MTTPDLNDLIGRTGLYATGPKPDKRTLRVRVRIISITTYPYGWPNVTVVPADGEGELGVRLTSLELDDAPETVGSVHDKHRQAETEEER